MSSTTPGQPPGPGPRGGSTPQDPTLSKSLECVSPERVGSTASEMDAESTPPTGRDSPISSVASGTAVSPVRKHQGQESSCAPGTGSKSPDGRRRRNKDSEGRRQRREAAAAKSQAEYNRIRLALWPTPEAVSEVLKAIQGDAINFQRLLDNVKWRDLWMTFRDSKTPSTKMRDELKKLAVTFLGKRKKGQDASGALKRSAPPPRKTHKPIIGEKRLRSTASLSSTDSEVPSHRPAPGKIPRVSKGVPAASCVSRQDSESSATVSPADGEVSDPMIEDEAHEPSFDQFAQDLAANLPYAAVAGQKGAQKKVYSPYFLYIHQGQDSRGTLTKATWDVFYEKFNELLLEETLDDKPTPDCQWTSWRRGVGFIMTKNAKSVDLVKMAVSKIKVAEFTFRAWSKDEKGECRMVSIRLPHNILGKAPAGKLAVAIAKKNGIPLEKWQLVTTRSLPSKDKELKINVDQEVLDILKKLDGRVILLSAELEVHLGGTRISSASE